MPVLAATLDGNTVVKSVAQLLPDELLLALELTVDSIENPPVAPGG